MRVPAARIVAMSRVQALWLLRGNFTFFEVMSFLRMERNLIFFRVVRTGMRILSIALLVLARRLSLGRVQWIVRLRPNEQFFT